MTANWNEAKTIIAGFLNTTPDAITDLTVIDNSALQGSILIHRMYGRLAQQAGIQVKNIATIHTFGDLKNRVEGITPSETSPSHAHRTPVQAPPAITDTRIGIDIESVDQMPDVADYREDPFYTQNFSPSEIAYCTLQPHPRQSFAGRFAAKEAIVKADNTYKVTPFNQIEIVSIDGQPTHPPFALSISHNGMFAIAVAVLVPATTTASSPNPAAIIMPSQTQAKSRTPLKAALFLLIALVVFGLCLFKFHLLGG